MKKRHAIKALKLVKAGKIKLNASQKKFLVASAKFGTKDKAIADKKKAAKNRR